MGECLEPVRQRELAVCALRLAECAGGRLIRKAVDERDATEKRALRRRRAGRRNVYGAKADGRRCGRGWRGVNVVLSRERRREKKRAEQSEPSGELHRSSY